LVLFATKHSFLTLVSTLRIFDRSSHISLLAAN